LVLVLNAAALGWLRVLGQNDRWQARQIDPDCIAFAWFESLSANGFTGADLLHPDQCWIQVLLSD
jgi:hypothetical protein